MYQQPQPQKSSVLPLLLLIAAIVAVFYFGPSLGLGKAVSTSLGNAGKNLTSSVNAKFGADQRAGNSYQDMAWNDALAAGIPPQLFVNQINDESGFKPDAVGSNGDTGIAQLMPDTAKSWGVNPYDPVASLQAAAQHMAMFYRNNGNDYAKALAVYNAGEGGLQQALTCGAAWRSCLPVVTQNYIHAVMG